MKTIHTPHAPEAIGPYSQAVVSGNLVFCSGCIPLNPKTMKVEVEDIEGQTEQVIKNMAAVLSGAGSSMSQVLKTTVFLKDMNDFQQMNGVYTRLFEGHKPARSTVQVAKLPLDVRVEIECVASLS